MMVMTAKVDKKKLILVLAGAAILLAGMFWLFGGDRDTPTAGPSLASNEGRVAFLKELGWDVAASPKESGQVRIPEPGDPVFDRYNELQKSQGYDLGGYGGKTVMEVIDAAVTSLIWELVLTALSCLVINGLVIFHFDSKGRLRRR